MELRKLVVLGAGSIRCAPAVMASLATYDHHRLEIWLYDADEERLDLFDMVGRTYMTATKAKHTLLSTTDPAEALDGADHVIVMIDENCATRRLKELGKSPTETSSEEGVEDVLSHVPESAEVLSLVGPLNGHAHLDWPGEVPEGNTVAVALETLRIARGEENPFPFLEMHAESPLREWLDGAKP